MGEVKIMRKQELLKQLKELGVHPDGRKVRSDLGQSRGSYTPSTKPRTDKGKQRKHYDTTSPRYHKKRFQDILRFHTNEYLGLGDHLVRDANLIFPPTTTNKFKTITVPERIRPDGTIIPGYSYKSSVAKGYHPEELRWTWFFAEYEQAPTQKDKDEWLRKICRWYFIKPEEIDLWNYQLWATEYTTHIAGHENRLTKDKIILSYPHARDN